ncbi:MAG TPA: heavy metal-associated domain-containing protein [Thermoleophilaceae bacterium]|nr:heavy metal-associated domain-containing protein [Thermoleophilaceae bacterium]
MTQEAERIYPVEGMTCAHCEAAVGDEVLRVAGVSSLTVDRGAGSLTVRGRGFADEAVRAAVERAGYRAPPG